MENATEALRMAAWVLIFVLALSISMNAFALARQSIDNIVLYSDREYLSTYVEESPNTRRIVGAESIVPTIYRAYRENIKIKFDFINETHDDCLYIKKNVRKEDGTIGDEYVNYIDLERETIQDEKVKEYIIRRILFGDKTVDTNNVASKVPGNIIFQRDGLYERIKGYTYEEYLGVYFQEEKNGAVSETTANKTEKKVITYVSTS